MSKQTDIPGTELPTDDECQRVARLALKLRDDMETAKKVYETKLEALHLEMISVDIDRVFVDVGPLVVEFILDQPDAKVKMKGYKAPDVEPQSDAA